MDFIGRGTKKALKNLYKQHLIKYNITEYSVLNENGDEVSRKVKIYTTTADLAQYLGVKNDPEVIRNSIEKKMK